MYQEGFGVRKDYGEALRWYTLSAEQGNPDAEYSLGVMYLNGQGVRKDLAEALKWLRRAAGHGQKDAARELVRITGGR